MSPRGPRRVLIQGSRVHSLTALRGAHVQTYARQSGGLLSVLCVECVWSTPWNNTER